MFAKFQDVARKAQIEASAFGQKIGKNVDDKSRQLNTTFTLEKECARSAEILRSFLADPSHPESALNVIPKVVLSRAKGLGIFSVYRAGFVWSGKIGSGIVIARLPDGSWSAPCCVATGGVGFGLQIGADLSEFVIVLNSDEAVAAFSQGNVTIGGTLSVSAGPVGTGGGVNTSLLHPSPLYSYSKNTGLFAGLSLDGTVLLERKDTNTNFYGQPIPARDLLQGKVPPPEAAAGVYDILELAETDELPSGPIDPPVFDADRDEVVAK